MIGKFKFRDEVARLRSTTLAANTVIYLGRTQTGNGDAKKQIEMARNAVSASSAEPDSPIVPTRYLGSSGDRLEFAQRISETANDLRALEAALQSGNVRNGGTVARMARRVQNSFMPHSASANEETTTNQSAEIQPVGSGNRANQKRGLLRLRRSSAAAEVKAEAAAHRSSMVLRAEELLYRTERDLAIVKDENAPPPIRHIAENNSDHARQLMGMALKSAGNNADYAVTEECRKLIRTLPGFDESSSTSERSALQTRLKTLFSSLVTQSEESKHVQDDLSAFKLVYHALTNALTAPGEMADPARASAALDALMHPTRDLQILAGYEPEDNAHANLPDALLDARAVVYSLAPLRRGTELLQRTDVWNSDAISIQSRGLTVQEQSLKVLLLTGKALAENLDAMEKSTEQYLRTAQSAAWKELNGIALTENEKIAYAAVRNGFLDTDEDSSIRSVSKKIGKVFQEWLPRAKRRIGPHNDDNPSRIHRMLNRFPMSRRRTGNTPLRKETVALGLEASTIYSFNPEKVIEEIDRNIINSIKSLKDAVILLCRNFPDSENGELLLHCAAAEIAMEEVQKRGIRPEHCQLNGVSTANTDDADVNQVPINTKRIKNKLIEIKKAGRISIKVKTLNTLASIPIDSDMPQLHRPLKAEHLIEMTELLLQVTEELRLDNEHPVCQAAIAAADEAKNLEALINTSQPQITDVRDVYRNVVTMVDELQQMPRGKWQLKSGYHRGFNISPISYAVNGVASIFSAAQLVSTNMLAAFSLFPRLKYDGLSDRRAIMEVANSSLGVEIFIGDVHKMSNTGVLGVGAGIGNPLFRLQAIQEGGGSSERMVREGVKLTIPRNVGNGYTEEDMWREARTLIDYLFQMSMTEDGEVYLQDSDSIDDDIDGMPKAVADLLALCPHVSIADIDEVRGHLKRTEHASIAGVRFGGRLSAMAGGGKRMVRIEQTVIGTEQTGIINVERRTGLKKKSDIWNVALSPSTSVLSAQGAEVKQTGRLGTSGASIQKQTDTEVEDTRLRLVSVDGKTDPVNTRREIEYADADTFVSKVRENFEHWLQMGVGQIFKKPPYDQFAGASLHEKRSIVEQYLSDTLEEFSNIEEVPDDERVLQYLFTESYRMTDAAAMRYDTLCDEQTLVEERIAELDSYLHDIQISAVPIEQKTLDVRRQLIEAELQKEQLIEQKEALLRDDISWQPHELTKQCIALRSKQNGVDLFVRSGEFDKAEGQRQVSKWPA